MSSFSSEEIARGLERWLKYRRDECAIGEHYTTIDNLLDEVRDNSAEGGLPWQVMDDEYDEYDESTSVNT